MARNRHTPKRPSEQSYYVERVSRLGYEPTVKEEPGSPDFTGSDQLEEPTITPTTRKRRPRGRAEDMLEGLKRNGAIWIFTVVMGPLLVFSIAQLFDLKGTVERVGAAIDGLKRDISRQDSDIKDATNKIHNQELKQQEQGIKIDYLEKELNKKQ